MNEDFYILLVYKQLNGDITPEEREELAEWCAQSKDNASAARAVELAWNMSGTIRPEVPVIDKDLEYAKMMGKLQQLQAEKKDKDAAPIIDLSARKKKSRQWWAVAAAILMIPILFFVVQNLTSGSEEIRIVEVQTTAGEKQEVLLPDNSKVLLNENSVLKYPNAFSSTNREIELAGEAFFEVEHDPNQSFIVHTQNIDVQVLGTEFNVKANPEATDTRVQVVSGRVAMKRTRGQAELILSGGQAGNYNMNNQELNQLDDLNENDLAWRTGVLSFDSVSMEEIILTLEDFYNCTISLENPALGNCTFSDTFDNLELPDVLEILGTVLSFESEKTGDQTYLLKGGSCQ